MSTSNFKPARTALTIAGTLVIFALMRCVFFVIPDAFSPYPEMLFDLSFYTTDAICKSINGTPQVLIQGTSRSQTLQYVPIGKQYWRGDGKLVNISIAGNTFWHMAAIRRRNPGLAEHTDMTVTDLVPMGLYVGRNFEENEALFFREGTLSEKMLIRKPLVRFQALADIVVPVWSRRYLPSTWWNALTHLDDSPSERLETLRRTPYGHFAEFRQWIGELEATHGDKQKGMHHIADIDYPLGPLSRVQEHAFHELVAQAPPNGYLVLFHPPYRPDFAAVVNESPARQEIRREFKLIAEAAQNERVIVRWFDDPQALKLTDEDFAIDGLHFSKTGDDKVERYLGQLYRELYPSPEPRGDNNQRK